jgi:peptidylprolyl isomerase
LRSIGCAALLLIASGTPAHAGDEVPLTMASVLEAASVDDWVELPQADLLYLVLEHGTVVFEVARDFAPRHVANIDKLTDERYFDGLAILRSQDNYVVQWGDPAADSDAVRSHGDAEDSLEPEFYRDASGLPITAIDSRDAYADEVGFLNGFPVGSDGKRVWLAHCYGMLGAGRANEPDSGSGAELYVVTGHAPRHLDRNVTLLGRTVYGIEHLSSLPRGTGPLGFYESAGEYIPVVSMRFGDELESSGQIRLERLRTDTPTFDRLVEARRNRLESWFADPSGRIGLCNVPIPVRAIGE